MMTEKQKIISGLKRCNKGAEVINKEQIAKFLGSRSDKDRVRRIVKDLHSYEEKHKFYLVTDVAEAYMRTAR